MSNSIRKSERAAYKDFKQAPAQDGAVKAKGKKKAKPVVVEYKLHPGSRFDDGGWHRYGRYTSEEVARQVIEKQSNKHGWMELRIKSK